MGERTHHELDPWGFSRSQVIVALIETYVIEGGAFPE